MTYQSESYSFALASVLRLPSSNETLSIPIVKDVFHHLPSS